jgi:hypothetical protein
MDDFLVRARSVKPARLINLNLLVVKNAAPFISFQICLDQLDLLRVQQLFLVLLVRFRGLILGVWFWFLGKVCAALVGKFVENRSQFGLCDCQVLSRNLARTLLLMETWVVARPHSCIRVSFNFTYEAALQEMGVWLQTQGPGRDTHSCDRLCACGAPTAHSTNPRHSTPAPRRCLSWSRPTLWTP